MDRHCFDVDLDPNPTLHFYTDPDPPHVGNRNFFTYIHSSDSLHCFIVLYFFISCQHQEFQNVPYCGQFFEIFWKMYSLLYIWFKWIRIGYFRIRSDVDPIGSGSTTLIPVVNTMSSEFFARHHNCVPNWQSVNKEALGNF